MANHKDLLKTTAELALVACGPEADVGDKIKDRFARANSSVVEEKHALLTDVKFTYNGGMFRGLGAGG